MQVSWLPLPSPYFPHVQGLKCPLGVPALGGVHDIQNQDDNEEEGLSLRMVASESHRCEEEIGVVQRPDHSNVLFPLEQRFPGIYLSHPYKASPKEKGLCSWQRVPKKRVPSSLLP